MEHSQSVQSKEQKGLGLLTVCKQLTTQGKLTSAIGHKAWLKERGDCMAVLTS